LEMAVGAYPWKGGIPSLGYLIRRLRQPEGSIVEQSDPFRVVKYGAVFSFFLPVITPHAYVRIGSEQAVQVFQLEVQGFLNSDKIRFVKRHLMGQVFFAVIPGISSVIGAAVSNIVSHDAAFLCNQSRSDNI